MPAGITWDGSHARQPPNSLAPAFAAPLLPHRTPLTCALCSVVFPMLCFDDEDAELWEDDPQEYIRKVRHTPTSYV